MKYFYSMFSKNQHAKKIPAVSNLLNKFDLITYCCPMLPNVTWKSRAVQLWANNLHVSVWGVKRGCSETSGDSKMTAWSQQYSTLS